MDWLSIWGVAYAMGFAFKPIMQDLATEATKDYAKDFFKNCLGKVVRLPEKNIQKEAYGKALKVLLDIGAAATRTGRSKRRSGQRIQQTLAGFRSPSLS